MGLVFHSKFINSHSGILPGSSDHPPRYTHAYTEGFLPEVRRHKEHHPSIAQSTHEHATHQLEAPTYQLVIVVHEVVVDRVFRGILGVRSQDTLHVFRAAPSRYRLVHAGNIIQDKRLGVGTRRGARARSRCNVEAVSPHTRSGSNQQCRGTSKLPRCLSRRPQSCMLPTTSRLR